MYLLAKFGGQRSNRNRDINSYTNSHISIRHIARFLKSGIPICNSKVPDTTGRKMRRKTQGNCKAFCVSLKRNKLIQKAEELNITSPLILKPYFYKCANLRSVKCISFADI